MPRGHPPGRRPGPCRHCDMVSEYVDERYRQLVALEDDPELMRDESARSRVIVFGTWLRHYPWPPREVVEFWSRPAVA